jgi:hypothetical protein
MPAGMHGLRQAAPGEELAPDAVPFRRAPGSVTIGRGAVEGIRTAQHAGCDRDAGTTDPDKSWKPDCCQRRQSTSCDCRPKWIGLEVHDGPKSACPSHGSQVSGTWGTTVRRHRTKLFVDLRISPYHNRSASPDLPKFESLWLRTPSGGDLSPTRGCAAARSVTARGWSAKTKPGRALCCDIGRRSAVQYRMSGNSSSFPAGRIGETEFSFSFRSASFPRGRQ